MNFVTELSESKSCDAILMIIDQLTKMRHYIVYKNEEEKTFTEQTAQMYIKYI